MKHQNSHQLARERTRHKILTAAKELFISKGFSGTSMAALSKAAGINQSLFYHYFESKEDLWRAVKSEMLKTFEAFSFSPVTVTTLDQLLKYLIEDRLNLYLSQPDLVRILLWQSLEGNESHLLGLSRSWVASWLESIQSLQDQGMINTRFTSQEIFALCTSAAWTPFLSQRSAETRIDPTSFSKKVIAGLKILLTGK